MLTGKELAELKRLEAKAKESAKPMTEGELQAIEDRVRDVYHDCPNRFQGMLNVWNDWCALLQIIAQDNARLVQEVRRLSSEARRDE